MSTGLAASYGSSFQIPIHTKENLMTNEPAPHRRCAVIYARVASRNAEDAQLIQTQEALCREQADALDAVVVQHFADVGVAGTTTERPGLAQLLDYLATSPTDYVICTSASKLGRSQDVVIKIALQIQRHGAAIAFAETGDVVEVVRREAADAQ
jgi:DNA invertase Pin-like site-specific DNA recombinase